MEKIRQIISVIRRCNLSKFLRYNYLSRNIKRKSNCYIYPYRNSIIDIDPNAEIILHGNLYLNYNKIADSKAECYLVVGKNAKFHIKGDVSLRFNSTVQINPGAVCEVGHFTTNAGVNIQCSNHITIGDDCMMGRNVFIFDSSFHPTGTSINNMKISSAPVVIGDHVWLGANSSVMQGTTIGSGSIIAMNSNVSGVIRVASLVMAGTNSVSATGMLWARGMDELSSAKPYIVSPEEKMSIDLPEQLVYECETKIKDTLKQLMSGIDFESEKELVDNKIIDSLSLMTIVAALSDKLNVEIPYTEINGHNFNNVHNMAIMTARLKVTGVSEAVTTIKEKKNISLSSLELSKSDTKRSVVERIFQNAKSMPESVAIISDDKETSFSQLADMIYSYSLFLKDKGVSNGDCVVVQAVHKVECIAMYYAVQLCGGILVPAEKTAPSSRLLEIGEDTKAVLIISLASNDTANMWIRYEELGKISIKKSPPMESLSFPAIDQPCEMVFTTGTTGKSKGVLMTHANMSWYAYSIAKCIEMKKGNRFFITTPLNHAGGLRRTHLSLANGCTVVYMDGISNLAEYFRYIEQYGITALYLPPVAIRILLTQTGKKLAEYAEQIDFVYSSSSSMPVSDCEQMRKLLPKTRLYNAYEASETPGVSAYDYNTENSLKNCIGKANEGVEIAIADESGNIITEKNKEGNICIRSKMNMKEYFLAPELTNSVIKDDWFVSSDLGYVDEEGNLFYSGRKGDVINIGGYKISPVDIEDKALESGMVKECICIEAFDTLDNNYLKLLAVPIEPSSFDPQELIKKMSLKLETYKIPKEVEITNEIKKTFNGKINRKAYRN